MSAWTTAVAALSPVAWWKFNGNLVDTVSGATNGSKYNDPFSPSAPDANTFGFAPTLVPGDTGGQCLHIGSFMPTPSGPYNLGAALYFATQPNSTYSYVYFWKWDGGGAIGNNSLYGQGISDSTAYGINGANDRILPNWVGGSAGVLAYQIADPGGAGIVATSITMDKVYDGDVHMFVVTAGSTFQSLYIDGVLVNQTTRTSSPTRPGPQFGLGAAYTSGWWDEAVFFNAELTPTQVANLWSASGVAATQTPLTQIPPGQRFAVDVDGTQVHLRRASGAMQELTTSQKRVFMAEDDSVLVLPPAGANTEDGINPQTYALVGGYAGELVLKFPEPRNIYAMQLLGAVYGGGAANSAMPSPYLGYDGSAIRWLIEVSKDTTNGLDGTWSAVHLVNNIPHGSSDFTPSRSNTLEYTAWGQAVPGAVQTVTSMYSDHASKVVDTTAWTAQDAAGTPWWLTMRVSREILRRRIGIPTPAISSVRGMRIKCWADYPLYGSQNITPMAGLCLQTLHIYGEKVGTVVPNAQADGWSTNSPNPVPGSYFDPAFEFTVDIWHPTITLPSANGAAPNGPLIQDTQVNLAYPDGTSDSDQGTVATRESHDWTFRVKNRSSYAVAFNITVTVDSPHDNPAAPFSGQLMLSDDGEKFFPSITITSLAPGAVSETITLRRVTPQGATSGFFMPRIVATVESWAGF